jgi:RNA polymerase sigma-70 factor (ECF subfamily)
VPRTDADIMRDVQSGREDCFEELALRYRPRLQRAARSRFSDPAAADDAVQETLLAAYASRGTFNPRFAFSTWIWTIFLNVCRRAGRKSVREQEVLCLAAATNGPQADVAPGAHGLLHLLEDERRDELHRLLDRLPEAEADALRLRFFGGLKFEDIAAAMECSVSATKVRVKRGLLRLAKLWREALDERGPQLAADSTRTET